MRLALAVALLLLAPASARAEWTGQTLSSPHRFVDDPTVIVAGNGGALAAWRYQQGERADRVYVALRRAGHGFGKPRRLATGRIRGVATAIGERGDVLVSWDARGVLRT